MSEVPLYVHATIKGNTLEWCADKLRAAVERTWHISDSLGQILALAFRTMSIKPLKLFPLRLEAKGPRFTVYGTWFRVQGSGLRVQGFRV